MKKSILIVSVVLVCALAFGACSQPAESVETTTEPESTIAPSESATATPTPTPEPTPTPSPSATPSPEPTPTPKETEYSGEYLEVYDMELPIDSYIEITENEGSTQILLTDGTPLRQLTVLQPVEVFEGADIIMNNMDLYFEETWAKQDESHLMQNSTIPVGDVEANYISFLLGFNENHYYGIDVMFIRDGKFYNMNLLSNYFEDGALGQTEIDYFKELLQNIKFD